MVVGSQPLTAEDPQIQRNVKPPLIGEPNGYSKPYS